MWLCHVDAGQVLKRNREPHTRTMWTRAKENAFKQKESTMAVTSTSLRVDDDTAFREQLQQLREENTVLKEALEEVRTIDLT